MEQNGRLLTKLQSMTEHDLLAAVVIPLMRTLGYQVSREGGVHESGRDLVCVLPGPLGVTQVVVVLVKSFRPHTETITRRAVGPVLHQLEHALETPVVLPDRTEMFPTSVMLVTPFRMSPHAGMEFMNRISGVKGRGLFIDGERLDQLVNQHLPSLVASLLGSAEPRPSNIVPIAEPPAVRGSSPDVSKAMDFLAGLRADIDHLLAPSQSVDPTLCFVIMSFSENPVLADFYEKAIKPTIEDLEYRCERIDEQVFNGRIMERVFFNLRVARLVVADLTEARPNCYYELGVAHALRKEVIHLAYSGEELHFDVKDWNFIIYSRLDELAKELGQRILGTVGRGGMPGS